MRLPDILQFHIQLRNSRRRQEWEAKPERFFSVVILGPLILVAGLAARSLAKTYLLPVMSELQLLLASLAAVIAAGVIGQLQLHREAAWRRFVAAMPVGGWDMLIVRIYSGLPATLIALVIACFAVSAEDLKYDLHSLAVDAGLIAIALPCLLLVQSLILSLLVRAEWKRPVWGGNLSGPLLRERGGRRRAQMIIEALRMLRGEVSRLLICLALSIILVLSLRQSQWQAAVFAVAVFAAVGVGERSNLLLYRRGDKGYDVYGVDGADYLLAVMVNSGLVVLFACLIQVPLLWNDRANGRFLAGAVCGYAGISLATLGRILRFDSDRKLATLLDTPFFAGTIGAGYINQMGVAILFFILRLRVIRWPALLMGAALMLLAVRVSGIVPLLIIALAIGLEARLTSRRTICVNYWNRAA